MSNAPPPRGPPPGPPPGRPPGVPPSYPQARGPPPGSGPPRPIVPMNSPPRGPPGIQPRGPPPGGPPTGPPGRGPPAGSPPPRGPPPGGPPAGPPGRGPPPGGPPIGPPGRGPPAGSPPPRGPPPGGPPTGPPGRGPPAGSPPPRGPPLGGPPGRGPPAGSPPPRGPPGRGPPAGSPPLRGPPPGMPPGRGPPGVGMVGRGPPPGMPLGRGPPPGMPPNMAPGQMPRGPPSGMPPRGPPPGMAPPGQPGRGPPRPPPGVHSPSTEQPQALPGTATEEAASGVPPSGPPGPPRGPPARPLEPTSVAPPPGTVEDSTPSLQPSGPMAPPRGPPGPPRGPPGPPRGPPGHPGNAASGSIPPQALPPSGAFDRFGKLTIKVLRAFELKKLGMMDTADPFVRLTIGAQNYQTKVHEKGGRNPEFDESFEFNISTEKELVLEVLDKEDGSKDRMMGHARVDIVPWLTKGNFDGDIDLIANKDEQAGKLSVSVKFIKPSVPSNAPIKEPPTAPPVLSGPAVAPLPPGSNAVNVPGSTAAIAPSEPPRDPNGKFTDKEILEAFQAFDLDHNNYVGAAEIRHVLINIGESPTDEEVDEMIKMVDKDGDGQVSFDEFYAMVTKGQKPPPGFGPTPLPVGGQPAGSSAPVSTGAQAIQQRKERKSALEEFARDNGIKSESVKKAYKRFQATDQDDSGLVDYAEFCEVMQVDPSPVCQKVFQLFDNERIGKIDMREFSIALSNFSGAEKEEKLKFAFLVYDSDGNGVLTRAELVRILKANHMASSEAEVARKADTIMAASQKDGNRDNVLTFDEFAVVAKRFPNILFPASL